MRRFTKLLTFVLVSFSSIAAMAQVETAYVLSETDQDLYIIDLDTGDLTLVAEIVSESEDSGSFALDDVDGLAFDASGTLFGSDNDQDRLVTIDRNTGDVTVVGAFNGAASSVGNSGMSFNSAGELYLATNDTLYTVNTSTAELSLVGSLAGDVSALAFDSNDVLYAIDETSDSLVTLSATDGTTLTSVALDIGPSASQGLHFDRNDTLYLIDEGSQGLYRVDTATGSTTLVSTLPFDAEALAIFEIPIQFQGNVAIPTLPVGGLALLILLLLAYGRFSLKRTAT